MSKNIIKIIIFIIILFSILYFVIKILWMELYSMAYYLYDEPQDSIDIVYVGASNVFDHFNSVLAYNEYGYTVGLLSTQSQPFFLIKNCIIESKKYQNPDLYIIDIAKVADNIDDITGEKIRKTTDCMKFSKNRIDAINEALSHKKNIDKKEYINYYFSFLMYHNRWKDMSMRDFKWNAFGKDILYKGYILNDKNIAINPQEKYIWSDKTNNLKEENKQILMELIDYIKSNNLNVLFVAPIRIYEEEIASEINDAINIIEANKFKVINFNMMNDLNIDFSTDFIDYAHLNVYGSTKYTLYFSKYLHENYELENHKNDKNYISWENEYQRFKKDFLQITNKNFDELLQEYKN